MPALAVIKEPNERISRPVSKEGVVEQKKKVKPSSLCYTPPAMINDKKRERSYFRHGLLGEGGFARCFEVTDFSGSRLAAKCIAKKSIASEKVRMKLLGEIKVHKSMDHPNIVRFRDCFEDEVNVYMILDICLNGTLMGMLRARRSFTEPEVRYYGLQILGAVKYMHSRRVIHRDLKLGNLLLDEDMCLKIGDFGLAALLVDDNDRKKTMCGTPNYIAPEVLFSAPEGHSYEVDLWSIGIILYAMLIGRPPFQSNDVKAIYEKIKTNEYEFPQKCDISPAARSLITSLLKTDPDNRPSIDDIASHHFFNVGIMPRSIPASATKQEPIWPAEQAKSIFKRNLDFVSINAGIGQNQRAGAEVGLKVDIAVERPEGGRYLPVSLSPQVGPKAKMINLRTQRAGGGDSLSDRLRSVQNLENQPPERRDRELYRPIAITQDKDLRRATLGGGPTREEKLEMPHRQELETGAAMPDEDRRPLTRLRGARRPEVDLPTNDARRAVPEAESVVAGLARPMRTITRSSRFSQLPIIDDGRGLVQGLSRPLKSTSTVPSDGRQSSRVAVHSRASSGASATSRTSSNDSQPTRGTGALLSRPTRLTVNAPFQGNTRSKQEHQAHDIWQMILNLANWMTECLSNKKSINSLSRLRMSDTILHITKWADYSHRYGLGYQLSDESTGVFFLDTTSIVLRKHFNVFDYIPSETTRETHLINPPPIQLEQKVRQLKHCVRYMTAHLDDAAVRCEGIKQESAACYMTHYWRSKQGILFRLSNGTLQLNFVDHSKLMIPMPTNLKDCRVRHVDVNKKVNIWSLGEAMEHEQAQEKLRIMAYLLQEFAKVEGRGRHS